MGGMADQDFDTALLDVDGTLIDSNYWHTVAWLRAFVKVGAPQPAWRIHTAIGMGGDRLVAAVAGDGVEHEHGDALREIWKRCYDETLTDVIAFPRAGDLVRALKERGLKVVLASSGKADHLEYARTLLNADDAIDAVTQSDDVDSSKPAGDLFDLALKKVKGKRAFVVGDAPWDVKAAQTLPVPTISLRCGGFAEETLREAGAAAVHDDPADLLAHLDDALAELAH
jgi:phosphoglycolate phosphatase-like HAD superfamily hydrolase